MKKIFLLLLIWIYPIASFSAINERKTDVYFANGIKTKDSQAESNAKLLRTSIIDKFGIEHYNQRINKVSYAYNNTNDMFIDGDGGFDLIESADQKLDLIKWRDWLASLVGYVTSHASDLKKQIDAYKASIDNGHSVLVVAHSQGNLFTGEAFAALGPCMQKQFEAVSIALLI